MSDSSPIKLADGSTSMLHRTLARQLRRQKLTSSQAPELEAWQKLLEDVSAVYHDFDNDHKLLERAAEVSSSELRQLNKQLAEKATTDSMTGLLNRASLMVELERRLSEQRAAESNVLGVLFIDLDGFKLINDRLGHAVGDDLLCVVADRLRGCVREKDLVARLGGDEFVILSPSLLDEKEAITLAERIVATVSRTITLPNLPAVGVGASVGVAAVSATQKASSEQLLAEADLAMYSAKMNGRNRVVAFSSEQDSYGSGRSTIDELREAIANDQLELHYQPLVCLEHKRIIAMESLVRWHHPERGLLPPIEFIPLAESSGLIHEVTCWVLKRALDEIASWPVDFLITINLSPRDLSCEGIDELLQNLLTNSGIDPNRVILEITEGSLVSSEEVVVNRLHTMLKTGIRLAIDDFGSGYSSLSQLLDLPIQIIKLDKKFVNPIVEHEPSRAVVKTIVQLANALGLTVVAEGIETGEQAEVLRQLGCNFGQGYFFGRPARDITCDHASCSECAFQHSMPLGEAKVSGF